MGATALPMLLESDWDSIDVVARLRHHRWKGRRLPIVTGREDAAWLSYEEIVLRFLDM
jgi:hypothetical protein